MSSELDYEINKELGECYLFMGEVDKAEDYYTKALNSNGTHAEPYLGLATIAMQRSAFEKAHELYAKAADIKAEDKALTGMAMIEAEQGQHEAAYGHYREALVHNPSNLIALLGLVQLGYALGRIEEIIPSLEAYLNEDPDKLEVRYTLAGCLASIGRKDEARTALEMILEDHPDSEQARELMEQISA